MAVFLKSTSEGSRAATFSQGHGKVQPSAPAGGKVALRESSARKRRRVLVIDARERRSGQLSRPSAGWIPEDACKLTANVGLRLWGRRKRLRTCE